MTRINSGVKPIELADQMLLAEHREIKRIPNTIKSGKAKISTEPLKFTLGKGHVVYFYNKLGYLKDRYLQLHKECIERGFNVTDYSDSFNGIDKKLFGGWDDSRARKVLVPRINERLATMKNIKYYSENIELEYITLTNH